MTGVLQKIEALFNKHKWIMVFLLAVPFFNDSYEGLAIDLDWIMNRLKLLSFLFLLVRIIIRKKKISILSVSLIVIELWWLTTTLIHYPLSDRSVYSKTITDMINAVAMGLIVENFADDPKNLLLGLMLNLELTIYPNIVSIYFGNPENPYYLLGFYSISILWILPALCVSGLYMLLYKKYIRASMLMAGSLLMVFMLKCATITVSVMSMAAVFLFGLVLRNIKFTKNIKILLSILFVIAVLGNVFVLFVYTGGKFPLIDAFIEGFLNRSTTFTERTVIWKNAIEMIKEEPWIGHGFRPSVVGMMDLNFIHSHNQFLQQLNASGIIGLILFVIYHVILCFRVDKMQNTVTRLYMVAASFAVSVTYITEAYKKFFRLYIVFFLAYNLKEMIESSIFENKKELEK